MRKLELPRFRGWLRTWDVKPDELPAFRVRLERAGLRATLVHRIRSDLPAFFRWAALDARLIGEAPIPRRLMPRLQERFPDRLSNKEVERISRIPDPYGFVVRLALATGLRWGELTRVQAAHVQHGVLYVAHTKSGKTRTVPVPPAMLAELKRQSGGWCRLPTRGCSPGGCVISPGWDGSTCT